MSAHSWLVHRHGNLKGMGDVRLGWGGNGWGGWGWGGIVMYTMLAALLPAVVVVVAFAIRDLVRVAANTEGQFYGNGPEDALAHRFARGEIEEDEYQRRTAILRERA